MSMRDLLVVPWLLGCSAPTSATPSPQTAPAPQETQDFRPLRFGDPEPLVYDEPFFAGAKYDANIRTPDDLLGQKHGTRLSHHAEILACLRAWDAASDRIRVDTFAHTHEGRELVWAAISSPANLAKLDAIRADVGKLYDPRGLSDAEAQRILAGPAVAWMGYSIHGDELSGSDAALALAYHLVASTDADVDALLDQLVVVIDPCLNPDGRERIIGMVEQSAGRTPNLDYTSMQRGRWPFGRGNHYLFDMNRDWMAGTQPETRGRWRAVLSFHPQLFVDAHEMWSQDTFLFYPQSKPYNPNLPEKQLAWNERYGAGTAAAFDAHGWAYYTREWADAWGPFYSDAWAALTGATGILYEQAATYGFPLKRESGRVLTYREAVHHQVTASWANLNTLREHRAEALADYLANAQKNVAAETPGNERMFVLRPGPNRRRELDFLRCLRGQEIEVARATAGFTVRNAVHAEGGRSDELTLPAGAWIVAARQPARARVHAFLDFDPRYDRDALQEEREELERKGRSKAYDVTSWSLPHAYDLDALWCDAMDVAREPLGDQTFAAPPAAPEALPDPLAIGWLVDGASDDALVFAAHAMELGLAVHWADEPFTAAGRSFARGSLLVRRGENQGSPEDVWKRVRTAALAAEVEVVPASTGRAPDEDSADLGGQHFHLLARPHVALLSNSPVSSDAYGHLWHHLDARIGVPVSILDAQALNEYDLRRFNVLVLPPASGLRELLTPAKDALRAWIEGGGTLIACADSAAALTKGALGLSQVALRQDALDDLESYRKAAERERGARDIEIDEALVWDGPKEPATPTGEGGATEKKPEPAKITPEDDARARVFSPQGATLRGIVDPGAWITAGSDDVLPVMVSGSDAFLAKEPVRTAVRLDRAPGLRLAGLLWPEARERLAESAWLTVERVGHGQIVLFAAQPAFRGYHEASARLFANAVVLGPGLGTDQPVGW